MSNTQTTAQFLSAPDAKQLIKETAILLDVRTPTEFSAEHIPNSINIPLDHLAQQNISDTKPIIVICQSGKRAQRAAEILRNKSVPCHVLEGGITAWKSSGFLVKKNQNVLSVEQQTQLIIGSGIISGVILGLTINRYFFAIPLFFGAGLVYAGISGSCTLALLLSKAPWNQRIEDKLKPTCLN